MNTKEKKHTYLYPFKLFIKTYWKSILLIEALLLLASFAGYSFLPFLRAINTAWGIIFIILFTIFAIISFIFTIKLFDKYDKEQKEIEDKDNLVRFFYFFASLIANGIIITIVMLIIRAIYPNTQYLIQGLAGIIMLTVYYLFFGLAIYLNPLSIYMQSKKEQRKKNKDNDESSSN